MAPSIRKTRSSMMDGWPLLGLNIKATTMFGVDLIEVTKPLAVVKPLQDEVLQQKKITKEDLANAQCLGFKYVAAPTQHNICIFKVPTYWPKHSPREEDRSDDEIAASIALQYRCEENCSIPVVPRHSNLHQHSPSVVSVATNMGINVEITLHQPSTSLGPMLVPNLPQKLPKQVNNLRRHHSFTDKSGKRKRVRWNLIVEGNSAKDSSSEDDV